MSAGVQPEEIQAIVEAVQPESDRAVAVELRDFDEPRRISAAQLGRLERTFAGALPALGADLQDLLRGPRKLSLGSIGEVDSRGLFGEPAELFTIASFRCHGQLGWVAWESGAAAACSEAILSGAEPEGEIEPRRLTPAEARLVEDLLSRVLGAILAPLGMSAEEMRLGQNPEELAREAGDDERADPQRLLIHLHFAGPGVPSELRIYVPGVSPDGDGRERDARPATVPEHLDEVQVDVRALLGSVDIPLSDLLRLEVGDVIPLGVHAGGRLDLVIEEVPCAQVHWGRHEGRLAVRIDQLEGRLAEEAQ